MKESNRVRNGWNKNTASKGFTIWLQILNVMFLLLLVPKLTFVYSMVAGGGQQQGLSILEKYNRDNSVNNCTSSFRTFNIFKKMVSCIYELHIFYFCMFWCTPSVPLLQTQLWLKCNRAIINTMRSVWKYVWSNNFKDIFDSWFFLVKQRRWSTTKIGYWGCPSANKQL